MYFRLAISVFPSKKYMHTKVCLCIGRFLGGGGVGGGVGGRKGEVDYMHAHTRTYVTDLFAHDPLSSGYVPCIRTYIHSYFM